MYIVFAILIFSFLILIHELGHFATAKAFGIQVNEFSLFMGPAIFKKQKGETLYSIRCIPFGGFCAMEGEDGDSDNPRAFNRAAWWKRFIVLCAGAFMNFVAGLLIMVIVCGARGNQVVVPTIASFAPDCPLQSETGLQVGDRLYKIDGERVYTYNDVSLLLSLNNAQGDDLSLKDGEVHDLVVIRDGKKVELSNFSMEKREYTENGVTSLRYGMTFSLADNDLGRVLGDAWYSCMDFARMVRLSLQMLFHGQASFRDMSGPVGIVSVISETGKAAGNTLDGILNVLYLGAFIAVNLAVMNLLPLPALDGGRAFCLLLTTAVEAITKKKINPKYEGYLHGAGMVILLLFMAAVTFKDVFQLFRR